MGHGVQCDRQPLAEQRQIGLDNVREVEINQLHYPDMDRQPLGQPLPQQ